METLRSIDKQAPIKISLWDLTGDINQEHIWPVAQRNADGIVIMYNADIKMNEEELEGWVKSFPQKMKMAVGQVMPVAWHINSRNMANAQPESRFGMEFKHYHLQENGEVFLDAFDKFVVKLNERKQCGNTGKVIV